MKGDNVQFQNMKGFWEGKQLRYQSLSPNPGGESQSRDYIIKITSTCCASWTNCPTPSIRGAASGGREGERKRETGSRHERGWYGAVGGGVGGKQAISAQDQWLSDNERKKVRQITSDSEREGGGGVIELGKWQKQQKAMLTAALWRRWAINGMEWHWLEWRCVELCFSWGCESVAQHQFNLIHDSLIWCENDFFFFGAIHFDLSLGQQFDSILLTKPLCKFISRCKTKSGNRIGSVLLIQWKKNADNKAHNLC